MRSFKIFAIGLMATVSVFGMSITQSAIESSARAVLASHGTSAIRLGAGAPESFGEARDIGEIVPILSNSGRTLAFVVNLEPKGYMVFSADFRIDPLLAFSYLCDFSFDESPRNALLNMIRADIESRSEALPYTAQSTIDRNHRLWRELLENHHAPSFAPMSIRGPLMDTRWHQSSPYNDFCPIDPETGDRCVVGCTATSMAQIINYWEYPTSVHFDDTESYWSDSTEPPIWIEAATATIESIDYNGAGVHPDNRMKAAISWAAGVSIYSIYGSEGTIAWFHDSSYTDKWGFVSAEKVDPPEMDDFYDILRADILDAKPAQLGIFYYEPDTSGHAIVCDGWMDTGEYHLNYGWGGFYNAWYRLPEGLPPPMTIVRWAIIDIRPPHRADAGDIHEEAVLIEATSEESFRLDEIYPESDVDWYRCPVVPDSTYIFYTVGATNTRGELFWDSFDEPIIADENSHDALNFRIIFLPDSAGSCHLRVTGAHVGLYQLRYYTYPAPSIVFTMPEGGEVFDEGTTQILRWNREGFPSIPRIDIAYSLDGPAGPWTVFGDSISNSGFHLFDVPNVETSLHDCRIRITEATSDRFEFISEAFTIRDLTGISEIALPTELSISTYPNPFNSSVRIKVESGEWRVENVEIYDLSGRRVGEIPVGEGPRAFPLDGNSENGSAQGRSPTIREFIWQPDESLPSGVFLVRATIAGDKGLKPLVQTKRMVFLK